jgi:hypothetical protein
MATVQQRDAERQFGARRSVTGCAVAEELLTSVERLTADRSNTAPIRAGLLSAIAGAMSAAMKSCPKAVT